VKWTAPFIQREMLRGRECKHVAAKVTSSTLLVPFVRDKISELVVASKRRVRFGGEGACVRALFRGRID